jgi:hypothetical protein
MDDPNYDCRRSRHAMHQDGNPLLLDRGVGGEFDIPDRDAADELSRSRCND